MNVNVREPRNAPPVIHAGAVVLEGATLGNDTVIGSFCFVASGAKIGRGTRIQSHTSVWNGVTLGEWVFVGPGAMFTNVRRPRAEFPRAPDWDETRVDHGATIGAHATVVAPCQIGAYAMIAAGAVVASDVPAHATVAGVPAKVVGWSCTCGASLGRFVERPDQASCTRCARAFEPATDGGLREIEA